MNTSEYGSTLKITTDLWMETKVETLTLSYAEVQEALEDYFRKVGDLIPGESVISMDIPVPLNDEGYIDIEIETLIPHPME